MSRFLPVMGSLLARVGNLCGSGCGACDDAHVLEGKARIALPPDAPRSGKLGTEVVAKAGLSFREFCEQQQLEVESGLAELIEGAASCVSATSEPGEPLVWVSDEFL